MSDTTNRQAYVFLDTSDNSVERTIVGDEYYIPEIKWWASCAPDAGSNAYVLVRRPIATPEQTDGLTIEQRVTALEIKINAHTNAHPAEQPRETCKWRPIETAPKDGTWILAINALTNPRRQHVVTYDPRETKYNWNTGFAQMDWVAGLTHWMPLEQPPTCGERIEVV